MNSPQQQVQIIMDETQIQLAVEIINRYFAGSEFSKVVIASKDIKYQESVDYIVPENTFNDFCVSLFDSESVDRSDTIDLPLFHFQSAEMAIKILQNRGLQASHLPAHRANDNQEYNYFMEQIRHPLSAGGRASSETMRQQFPDLMSIENIRDDTYISCFTSNDSDEHFWENYAVKHTGVCLALRYSPNGNKMVYGLIPRYYLRDMIYDNPNNNKFAFINDMNVELKKSVGCELMLTSVPQFAKFYKRNRYSVEKEIRFAIDVSYLRQRNSAGAITIQSDDGTRKYLRVPFINSRAPILDGNPFRFELVGVKCGKNMSDADSKAIAQLVVGNFPSATITFLKNNL
jgi:hypothetical protein